MGPVPDLIHIFKFVEVLGIEPATPWSVVGRVNQYTNEGVIIIIIIIIIILHIEELHSLYSSPNIVRMIKSRRLRWQVM